MARISVAQRRSDLVEAAVEVIAVHGIDGATTRRIAEQAKANLTMLHYCYDSKDDLFADVYKYVGGRYCEVVQGLASDGDLVVTARRLLRALMEYYQESGSFTAATLELVNWARHQHGPGGKAVYDQALDALQTALREASGDQPVDEALIDQISFIIATLADGFAINWSTYADGTAAAAQMDLAESVLESWLMVRLGAAPAAVV